VGLGHDDDAVVGGGVGAGVGVGQAPVGVLQTQQSLPLLNFPGGQPFVNVGSQ
jgi:hypothetical protein